ncbi:hypothetical protein HKD37_05G013074 [Glycine soja]
MWCYEWKKSEALRVGRLNLDYVSFLPLPCFLGCDSVCCLNVVLPGCWGKLGRIDGDPVLRETRIWATWEYMSSVGEWYLEICRGCQETLGTSGGVLLPKTKLDQSRPNPGIEARGASGNQLPGDVIDYQASKGNWSTVEASGNRLPIVMVAQLIHDRVEMECLEGAWETLEGNTRCRFRGTIRFTETSLVHPDEPVRTLQRTVEWILPTPTPYRLVEPVQVIEVTSSEEDPEEDPEELPPEPVVDALDFLEGDEDPEVDSPEEVMSASEADSTEDSGPREMATSGGSSS